MVKGAADIADDDPLDVAIEKLRECCPAEAVADLLGLATGVLEAVHGERSQQEISWAAREWAQLMAQTQPLILVFEDIHWAEEPLLELIEHMTVLGARRLADDHVPRPPRAARHPLRLGRRPRSRDGDRARAARRRRQRDSDRGARPRTARSRRTTKRALLDKTGGNPLFLEEVMLNVAECGEERAAKEIPDTVQALIAARIDRLDGDSKAVLQRASVIGRTFWGGAIEHLSRRRGHRRGDRRPAAPRPRRRGIALVAQERDRLPLQARAHPRRRLREPHEVGAREAPRAPSPSGCGERAGDELLEIRAHHLDHAASLLAELDGAPPADLAREAAVTLEEAGRRALAREANQAARHLFLRAVELEPSLHRRYMAAKAAWRLDDLPAVAREMEAVREESVRIGDKNLEGKALTALADMVLMREADPVRARELAEQALALIEDDPPARFDALRVAWTAAYWVGHVADSEHYVIEQLELARAAGRKDLESVAILTLGGHLLRTARHGDGSRQAGASARPRRGERRDQRARPRLPRAGRRSTSSRASSSRPRKRLPRQSGSSRRPAPSGPSAAH